ncbi:unnamed protein product [Schistocephalus solidus]|uniref:Uncharacterized protein n=1 Tax=Schistocephalus solidus TaxID=70667 RepID=A0A183SXE0_SCHSO|nr:unnamed protein product [Schistocephalus solidus]
MLLWPPLTGTQLSPLAPRSWVLPSGHTPGNRQHRWAKPGNPSSNRPERRTALVARELVRYNSITPTIIETTSQYSSPVTPTTATTTAFAFTITTINTTTTNHNTISDWDSLLNCPQCDRTFTSRIGLVDIAAYGETRFSEQGQLQEVEAGYNVFWKGHPKVERLDGGVAFAIKTDILGRLPCLQQGINDR